MADQKTSDVDEPMAEWGRELLGPPITAPETERAVSWHPSWLTAPDHDPVNHPRHYTGHPSGVECIDIVEHYPFNVGAAIKYLWRAGAKADAIEDLEKAAWYCQREADRLRQQGLA